jgi:hypothetical protein
MSESMVYRSSRAYRVMPLKGMTGLVRDFSDVS